MRDAFSGVEAIHACFTGHAYDLHRHDEWLAGVTDHGVQDFHCRGVRQRSTADRVILIEPQQAHDGRAGSPGGFSYRMLYLPCAWVKAGLADTQAGDTGFPETLVDDPLLAHAVRRACAILGRPPDGRVADGLPAACLPNDQVSRVALTSIRPVNRLLIDAALDAVMRLLRPHLERPARRIADGPCRTHDRIVARRARERLHDTLADAVGADALARAAGAADRFQLARAFRAAYGTSPHAYLVQQRLLSARRLLAGGEPPAGVAAACGFADQSHFGRWFRRAYGVTPAAYRTCCTSVPDRAAAIG
ncbi:AraC family transcriptional regulator [Rhodopila sp.]|uniref:AraC family transcriptional regulator n=1 Tax=Rhodopila sp. TaxID=2480087 RepID=UPI003D09FE48